MRVWSVEDMVGPVRIAVAGGWYHVTARGIERRALFTEELRDQDGDWGRDMVLYLARRRSGLSLKAVGEQAGGMDDKAMSQAVARLSCRLNGDASLRRIVSRCLRQL